MSDVRWAVAGYGVGGRVFHAPLVRAAEGMELVAVVSTNAERARQAETDGLAAVADLAELAALGVDGLTVTTPAGTHVDLAHQALDAGLHVVVDKPFALDAASARSVVGHARRAGRVLSVYQNRRWDGDFLTLTRLVSSGELGTVRRFTTRIERFHPDLPAWNNRAPAARGGGTLVDLGPHLIDQATQLFGRVVEVDAHLSRFGPEAGAEDDVVLTLDHTSGVLTTVVASLAAAARAPRFQLNTDLGGAIIEGFDAQEDMLFAGETPTSLGEAWGQEPPGRTLDVHTSGQVDRRPLLPGRWTTFYPAVARAVIQGDPVPVDPQDAVHTAAIFDAARRSQSERRRITVEPAT